jgi:hypothetical protein
LPTESCAVKRILHLGRESIAPTRQILNTSFDVGVGGISCVVRCERLGGGPQRCFREGAVGTLLYSNLKTVTGR